MVEDVLLGEGVSVSNIRFTGDNRSRGTFNSFQSNIGIEEGLILSTGRVYNAIGPNNSEGLDGSEQFGSQGDGDLSSLVGGDTYDASVLEFDFVPLSDSVVFNYVFASEEYIEFVKDQYYDVFGFFLSGPGIVGPFTNNAINVALIPGTTNPVNINDVNHLDNSQYYIDNGDGTAAFSQFSNVRVTQFDGFTVKMRAVLYVQSCERYHIKLAIADVNDEDYDSAVFLEKGSFSLSEPVANSGPDRNICSGLSTSIGFFPIAGQSYQWTPSTGLSNDTIANPILTLTNEGDTEYSVTYTLNVSQEGCTDFDETYSDEMIATVHPNPEYNVFDTLLCSGDTIPLRAENVPDDYVFSWTPSNSVNDVSLAEPLVFGENQSSEPIDIELEVQFIDTLSGCVSQETTTLTINSLPELEVDPLWFVCPGSDVQVEVSGVDSFLWSPNSFIDDVNIEDPVLSPPVSQTYYVKGIDEYGCEETDSLEVIVEGEIPTEAGDSTLICINDSVLIGGNPTSPSGVAYTWSNSIFLDDESKANPLASPDLSQYLYVETSSDTCSGRDSVFITVKELPEVSLPEDFSICFAETGFIKANGAIDYQWDLSSDWNRITEDSISFSASEFDEVIVTGIDSFQCENRDTLNVSIWDLPDVFAGIDTSICLNDSIELKGSGEGNPIWLINDDSLRFDSTWVSPDETDYFLLLREDSNLCRNFDSVQIVVHALPEIEMTSDTSVCFGTYFKLWSTGGDEYIWTSSDTLLSEQQTLELYPTEDAQFNVLVIDSNRCENSDSLQLTVLPEPVAGINYSWVPRCEGAIVALEASSFNAESHTWYLEGVDQSDQDDHQMILEFGDVYDILLLAENGVCQDSIHLYFNPDDLEDNFEIEYTEVLTLNNPDGINDELDIKITNEFEKCTVTKVFNRWGVQVYDSSEHDWNWYGLNEYNAQPVNEGVYYFVIEVRDQIIYKGYLTVFR